LLYLFNIIITLLVGALFTPPSPISCSHSCLQKTNLRERSVIAFLLTLNAAEISSVLSFSSSRSDAKLFTSASASAARINSSLSMDSSALILAAISATFSFSSVSRFSTSSACSRNKFPNFSKKPPSTCWILKLRQSQMGEGGTGGGGSEIIVKAHQLHFIRTGTFLYTELNSSAGPDCIRSSGHFKKLISVRWIKFQQNFKRCCTDLQHRIRHLSTLHRRKWSPTVKLKMYSERKFPFCNDPCWVESKNCEFKLFT
jgi:hypothetical protein